MRTERGDKIVEDIEGDGTIIQEGELVSFDVQTSGVNLPRPGSRAAYVIASVTARVRDAKLRWRFQAGVVRVT